MVKEGIDGHRFPINRVHAFNDEWNTAKNVVIEVHFIKSMDSLTNFRQCFQLARASFPTKFKIPHKNILLRQITCPCSSLRISGRVHRNRRRRCLEGDFEWD